MATIHRLAATALCAVLSTGCASDILSDARIASNTAGVLGVPSSELTISDRRTELTDTYYVARTRAGASYSCTINGGNALSLGLVNPPSCMAQATSAQPTGSRGRRSIRG